MRLANVDVSYFSDVFPEEKKAHSNLISISYSILEEISGCELIFKEIY